MPDTWDCDCGEDTCPECGRGWCQQQPDETPLTPPFPKHWTGVPLWFAEWEAPVPWAKS